MTSIYNGFPLPDADLHLAAERGPRGRVRQLRAATLGALNAVRRVAALPPAEAMRPEPPTRYRRSLIERAGLARYLSAPVR